MAVEGPAGTIAHTDQGEGPPVVLLRTEPGVRDPPGLRDLRKYARGRFDAHQLIADTEALARFTGDAPVLWENRVMPSEHGRAWRSCCRTCAFKKSLMPTC